MNELISLNNSIHHPTLILDPSKVQTNIRHMSAKARLSGCEFRPHFKTHQSREIASWFRDEGVKGITVSSIKMAEYFAADGWEDITIAVPVNIRAMDDLRNLSHMTRLKVLAVDGDTIQLLNRGLSEQIGVYVELDPDYGRSGLPFSETKSIEKLIRQIENSDKLNFCGFYAHAGHTYKATGRAEVEAVIEPVLEGISTLKKTFDAPVCFGDTPSCSVLEHFEAIDQLSPGNFVFYDWMQTRIGSCSSDEIAVALYAPVLAKYSSRQEVLIHGGAVHLSKDFISNKDGTPNFGVAAGLNDQHWTSPVEGAYLRSVSQEHGLLSCPEDYFTQIKVGDLIPILPIHSCLTADLMGSYLTTEGEYLDHLSSSAK